MSFKNIDTTYLSAIIFKSVSNLEPPNYKIATTTTNVDVPSGKEFPEVKKKSSKKF